MTAAPHDPCRDGPYRPPGLLLQWHVTQRCNLRCAHCYQEGHAGEELPFEGLRGVLRQYEELLAFWRGQPGRPRVRGHITVTGGEPLVRPDFLDLLDVLAAGRKRYRFAVLTNGTLIDQPLARRLRRLRPAFVQVSVEGGPATHDRIRGPGSYQRAVAGAKELVRAGVRTMLAFSAHRGNFREFPEVCRLGRGLGVQRVWADRIIPQGSGRALRDLVLTPEETREFFQIMAVARSEASRRWFSRTEVAMHRALQFLAAGGRPYRCTAGDSLLTVQPNGDVYPCRRMPVHVGNVGRTTLADVYYCSGLLQALRDRARAGRGCEACVYARLCGGGLRCLSYAVTGDPFSADPGCWLAARPVEGEPAEASAEPALS